MKLTKLLLAITALALASCCESAKGATFIYNLDTITTGATPNSPPPWATVTISDAGVNQVSMTFQSNLDTSTSNFIGTFALNFTESLDVTKLTWSETARTGSFLNPVGVTLSRDGIQGGGPLDKFDIGIDLSQGSLKFGGTDSVSLLFSYTGDTITTKSFDLCHSNNQTITASHIQGIEGGGTTSAWVSSVPEPSAALLGGIGLLGLLRRKRQ